MPSQASNVRAGGETLPPFIPIQVKIKMATTTPPIAPAPAESPDTMIGIMLYPERDKPQRNSPYRFPTAKTDKSSERTEMSMNGKFLSPGPNFVPFSVYWQMIQNPAWKRCVEKRVIEEIRQRPDSRATGTSADYDLTDAYTMIESAADEDWLKMCLAKDDRKEVNEWLDSKIKELQESAVKE